MRWLFLFVLALNFAYITWQINVPGEDAYTDVPPLKNVPPIHLLSEVSNNEQLNTGRAGNEQPAPDDQRTALAQQERDTKATEGQVVAEAGLAEEVAAEQVIVAAVVKPETPETVPENVPAKQVPVAVDDEVRSQPVSQVESCFTLGPFRDLDKLRALTREIKSYVVSADFRGREEKEQSLYWVYIKPEKNMSKAMEVGERLKANKIKDFYVIREGKNVYGISLGHFRNKGSAFRLARKVTKLGFEVVTEPVYKTYTVYWLDYQLADGVSIPPAILDKYLHSTKTDKISRLSRECDG